MVNPSGDRQEG